MACTSTNAADAASTSAADDADDEDKTLDELVTAAWEGADGPFLEDFLDEQGEMPNGRLDELSVLVDPEAYDECFSFDNSGILPRDGMIGIEEHGGDMQLWFEKSKRGLWRVAWRSPGVALAPRVAC